MYGYIYLTENLVDHKKYIGQHKSNKFDENYLGSGKRFLLALKKYGKENFSIKVLCECESDNELNDKEKYYISLYNATEDRNFYNISRGGEGFTTGLIHMYNPSTDDIIRIENCNVDYYKSIGFVLGTRPHSEEQIEHYKQGKKDLIPITNGEKTIYINKAELPLYESKGFRKGRHKATRPNQREENRKWVNKDGKSIMVKGDEVQSYLDNGYVLGRVKFSHFNRVQPPHNKGKKVIIVDGKRKYV